MTIYEDWTSVPELQLGEFLAINVTNDKPRSLAKNEKLFGTNQAGDWPIKGAVADRGLRERKILLYYGPGPRRTLYLGTILDARKEGWAANGQMRYRFTSATKWRNIGQADKSFQRFFSNQAIGSGSVTHWVETTMTPEDETNRAQPGEEVERVISQRVGQDIFAAGVTAFWGGRCALTGVSCTNLLEACHIVPWGGLDNERLSRTNPDNGLLLCAHLHKLFDAYQISFDDEGELLLRRDLDAFVRQIVLATGARRLRIAPNDGQRHFLSRHREMAEEANAEWEVVHAADE